MEHRHDVIATNKIIFTVIFVCAALITSLFVFRLSHRPAKKLPQEMGILFPEPREIASLTLVTTDGKPFNRSNLRDHWTLMFFGFTHCSNICPETLGVIRRAYPALKQRHPNLQVVFVSLDPTRDQPAKLQQYVQSFNKDFVGASATVDTLHKLQSQFGVYAARDEKVSDNYQIQHTASVYLLNPKGDWAGMFNYGLKPKDFEKAVMIGMKA